MTNQHALPVSEPSVHHLRETCRICGGRRLRRFLALGPTPLANSFLHSREEFAAERSYPLDVYFCEDCSLVQLLDVIDPSVLFRNYIYVTGTSDTIALHNVEYARTLVELLKLGPQDRVVEVASNDGSLLQCFVPYGVKVLGIEPASNIARLARAKGIETIDQFFNSYTAQQVLAKYGPAKFVIGNNVLAHVDATPDFLAGARQLLTDDGLVVVEVPYVRDLLNHLEYDTIYHEHLSYFSVSTLMRLCEAVGLALVRLDYQSVHGGSLRMYAGRLEHYGEHSATVRAWAEAERRQGITDYARYEQFATDVAQNARELVGLLQELVHAGKSLAAYGAPAKGNTLLNYCQIDPELIPYTVDKSLFKVNLYTPGMHIPVLPVSTLLERQPDYVLILAWNFAEEIIRQQQAFRERGGHFIIPLPTPRIV